jgi:hypothetical protein
LIKNGRLKNAAILFLPLSSQSLSESLSDLGLKLFSARSLLSPLYIGSISLLPLREYTQIKVPKSHDQSENLLPFSLVTLSWALQATIKDQQNLNLPVSTLDIPVKCECPGNPEHRGKSEAHSGSLCFEDQDLFLKAARVMVSPEGLLTNSVAAEVAAVFTSKVGECGSLWHGGGVKRC